MQGIKINLVRTATDSTLNFDFLLAAFQPNPDKISAASHWTFGLGSVAIEKAQLSYVDDWTAIDLQVAIPSLSVSANNLDFNQQLIDLA